MMMDTSGPMTVEEMDAMGRRANQIREACSRYEKALDDLALLKRVAKERKGNMLVDWSWKPEIVLEKAPQYSGRQDVSVRIEIPYGVVEQQLVYAADRGSNPAGRWFESAELRILLPEPHSGCGTEGIRRLRPLPRRAQEGIDDASR